MSGWSSDYSKYPRLFNGKCVTPKPLCKVSIEDKEARAANQWLLIQGIKNLRSLSLLSSLLDLPPPPVVRLAKSAIASNGVLNNIFFSCIASLTDHTKFPGQDWRWLIWQASSITCRHRLAERSYKQPGGFAHGHPFSHWGRNTVESQQQNGTSFCSNHPPT